MSKKPQTIAQFFKQFPDDEACLNHLFEIRFGQGFECPSCERPSNWYRIKAERAYSCQWCGHHLHPTVGTPFEQTRTPLQLWFYAIFLFTTTRNGVAAKELQRQLGVTYKTAWRMAHLIREHMADVDGEAPIGGAGEIVEADETFIGGVHKRGKRGGDPAEGKTIVFGVMERGGEIVTKVVPNRLRCTIFPIVQDHVEAGTEVHTDEYRTYATLGNIGYQHKKVNHAAKEYASRDGVSVNGIEGFWSQLKRSINGTHIHVSGKHLWKYAKEAEYRFNRRDCSETMLSELLGTFGPLPERPD
ncbi:IS1595 family transposase [Sphingobium soli]|uniref:IS1595 family transposase n=1 Tax=Sphingobium soli TaxID=1591116 RepID=A0ABS8HAP8_9SPHN|nr:IS1595 family transposase [Sphingobium soli]MCC4234153.1 IS1595 family transposase [Sphingobium soli]